METHIEMLGGWIGNGLGYAVLAMAALACATMLGLGSARLLRRPAVHP